MLKRLVNLGFALVFIAIGLVLENKFLSPWLSLNHPNAYWPTLIASSAILAAIGFLVAPIIVDAVKKAAEKSANRLSSMSFGDIMGCVIGLIAGLIIASLIGVAVARIKIVGPYLAIAIIIILGYIGFIVGSRKKDDIVQIFTAYRGERSEKREKDKSSGKITPKILDTSVIIDGRIADIYRSGFIEGDLIVAKFVLEELQHIADSGDMLKRNRGRGGLDILNLMQKDFAGKIIITDKDYSDIFEVDAKLLRLTQDLKGVIVTNDFNLNKIAQLQGVKVLNINELSNAVKPVVLPGEEMIIQVIKEGKEAKQGVAYLDDGTMIVIENGKNYVGKFIHVVVTSILQTAAGRMVFARPKYAKNGNVIEGSKEDVTF